MLKEIYQEGELIRSNDLDESAILFLAGHEIVAVTLGPAKEGKFVTSVRYIFHAWSDEVLRAERSGKEFKSAIEILLYQVRKFYPETMTKFRNLEFSTKNGDYYYIPSAGAHAFRRAKLVKAATPRIA